MTRAIAILRHLGRSKEPLGVNQLARALSLVPSTCLHILRVLTEEGLVDFDPRTKRYAIGIGILPIARSAIQRNGFISLIEPRLTELSAEVGATVLATRLADAEHMVVVALSHAPLPFRLQVELGSRFPTLISATGRCHAAFNLVDAGTAELRTRFAALKWDHPPAFDDWLREVELTRHDGFAVDTGRYISGVTILAVPMFGRDGRMTHSIVAIDISERITARGQRSIIARLLQVRDEVSNQMLGDGAG